MNLETLTKTQPVRATGNLTFEEALHDVRSVQGQTLDELSAEQPLLLVFLRHLGCTFCREALDDLRKRRDEIESKGAAIALVHLSDERRFAEFVKSKGLDDLPRFHDPGQRLYKAFGLGQGSVRQLFSWNVLVRGFQAALLSRHGFGPIQGNGFRLPGTFVLFKGKIIREFRHDTAADRPDYCELVEY